MTSPEPGHERPPAAPVPSPPRAFWLDFLDAYSHLVRAANRQVDMDKTRSIRVPLLDALVLAEGIAGLNYHLEASRAEAATLRAAAGIPA